MNAQTTAEGESRRANLLKRCLTGIPAMALLLALLTLAPWVVPAALLLAAALLGMAEYRSLLAGRPAIALPAPPLLAGAALVHGGAMAAGAGGQQAMLFLAILLWIAVSIFRADGDHARTMREIGLGVLGLVWIAWFLSHWTLLLHMADGRRWSIFLLLVVTGNDTFAYVVGSLCGRRALAPAISPNKTVEGALGGVAGGLLGGAIAALWLPWFQLEVPLAHVLILSALLALAGQLGDVVESLVKRWAGAKHSGAFLPGHGGFLDRLDSLLLTPPLLYYYLTLAGL